MKIQPNPTLSTHAKAILEQCIKEAWVTVAGKEAPFSEGVLHPSDIFINPKLQKDFESLVIAKWIHIIHIEDIRRETLALIDTMTLEPIVTHDPPGPTTLGDSAPQPPDEPVLP